MSATLMLDTNAASGFIKSEAAIERLARDHDFCISVLTEAELRFGLARGPVRAELRRLVEGFLDSADIRVWDSACARQYGRLRAELQASGRPLAPMDLMIATHALAAHCTLVTADRRFAAVPGLRVLDWRDPGAGH
ncbi:MAG: type II toxin-antitoxin system VapC family toxin [Betaproteobacteria bacterium]